MLPDKVIRQVKRDVQTHFGISDMRLEDAALKLADAGWPWEEIRQLLSKVYRAGYDMGRRSGSNYSDGEGYA